MVLIALTSDKASSQQCTGTIGKEKGSNKNALERLRGTVARVRKCPNRIGIVSRRKGFK